MNLLHFMIIKFKLLIRQRKYVYVKSYTAIVQFIVWPLYCNEWDLFFQSVTSCDLGVGSASESWRLQCSRQQACTTSQWHGSHFSSGLEYPLKELRNPLNTKLSGQEKTILFANIAPDPVASFTKPPAQFNKPNLMSKNKSYNRLTGYNMLGYW